MTGGSQLLAQTERSVAAFHDAVALEGFGDGGDFVEAVRRHDLRE